MGGKEEGWGEVGEVKGEVGEREWLGGRRGNVWIKVSEGGVSFVVRGSGKEKGKEREEDFVLMDE